MEIQRINTYTDERFSREALMQHGCFLVNDAPYEVNIISDFEAIVLGEKTEINQKVIEEFRFYAPHITKFYDQDGKVIREYPRVQLLSIPLDQIQPSQFYVDADKIEAVRTFIQRPWDIVIQVLPFEGRYISLDGHTRLYYAAMNGWNFVRAVIESADDWVYSFVEEAKKRNIWTPKDMERISHEEYEEKWNRFCDIFFAGGGSAF